MLKIDLDLLTEDELNELGKAVYDRVIAMRKEREKFCRATFKKGMNVTFVCEGTRYYGVVTRVNPKTLSIRQDNGQAWKATPAAVERINEIPVKVEAPPQNVLQFRSLKN